MRTRIGVAVAVVSCWVAATAAGSPAVVPNLNGKWTLDNEPTSVWTITVTGTTIFAARDGAPGHPELKSRFRGELADFGSFGTVVKGELTNTEGNASTVTAMCWTIRPTPVIATEITWQDCFNPTQHGKFVRYKGATGTTTRTTPTGTTTRTTPTKPKSPPPPPSPSTTKKAPPLVKSYGPILRG